MRAESVDKIPGYGQLQAFRDTILPLARKTAFKDKVYLYQTWLGRLRSPDREGLCSGIPLAENACSACASLRAAGQGSKVHFIFPRMEELAG